MTADVQTLLQSLREQESDWAVTWLIAHADPELWAPRQFIIVDELTKGSPTQAAIWRAIYRLLIFYKPLNQHHLGFRLIASVGGVGRGHLGGAIRHLHKLGLITVVGLDDNDRQCDRWEYYIDPAYLEALSIRFVRARMAAGQLVVKRRPPDEQQRDLFAALDLAADDAILASDGAVCGTAASIEFPQLAPVGAVGDTAASVTFPQLAPVGASYQHEQELGCPAVAPHGAMRHTMAPDEATTSQHRHPSVPILAPMGAGYQTRPFCAPVPDQRELAPNGASLDRPRHPSVSGDSVLVSAGVRTSGMAVPINDTCSPMVSPHGGHMAYLLRDLAPSGAHGSRERQREGSREGSAPSAPAHPLTEDAVAELIHRTLAAQLPAMIAQVGEAIAARVQPLATNIGLEDLDDHVLAPPGDEPPLPMSLLAIWEMVSDRPVSSDDRVHIKMLVDRYQAVTQGYSAYWLGRVMLFAHLCRTDDEPVKLKVVNAYMKRMASTTFSTATLEDRTVRGERAPALDPPRAGHRRAAAGAAAPPAPPRAGNALPAELAEHWVIEAWRRVAGPDPAITQERAQQLIATVTRQDVWEAVLSNWCMQYKSRANWTNFDGLLDWYRREASTSIGVTADAFDPNGPPPSASVIDHHPGLDSEQRATWYRRFHAAGESKAARQAVIKRLLAEHPIEPQA